MRSPSPYPLLELAPHHVLPPHAALVSTSLFFCYLPPPLAREGEHVQQIDLSSAALGVYVIRVALS